MSFQKVIDFINDHGLDQFHHSKREYYFKNLHPEIYENVNQSTKFLGDSTLIERIYCYVNNITERPKCKVCDNPVTLSKHGTDRHYHTYCGKRCAMLDMKTLIGVENASQLQSVKDKKKQTCLNNYGVESGFQITKVVEQSKQRALKRWNTIREEMIFDLENNVCNLSKKEYYKAVAGISNYMYNKHIDLIDPKKLRSNNYHLDHKISKCYGWQNKISPLIIGDFHNLEMISNSLNTSKQYRNSISINDLISQYNCYYEKNEKLHVNEFFIIPTPKYKKGVYSENAGKCKFCGQAAHYLKPNGDWLCQPVHNSCPAMRRKNTEGQLKKKAK